MLSATIILFLCTHVITASDNDTITLSIQLVYVDGVYVDTRCYMNATSTVACDKRPCISPSLCNDTSVVSMLNAAPSVCDNQTNITVAFLVAVSNTTTVGLLVESCSVSCVNRDRGTTYSVVEVSAPALHIHAFIAVIELIMMTIGLVGMLLDIYRICDWALTHGSHVTRSGREDPFD